jgi:hypothetical protein
VFISVRFTLRHQRKKIQTARQISHEIAAFFLYRAKYAAAPGDSSPQPDSDLEARPIDPFNTHNRFASSSGFYVVQVF